MLYLPALPEYKYKLQCSNNYNFTPSRNCIYKNIIQITQFNCFLLTNNNSIYLFLKNEYTRGNKNNAKKECNINQYYYLIRDLLPTAESSLNQRTCIIDIMIGTLMNIVLKHQLGSKVLQLYDMDYTWESLFSIHYRSPQCELAIERSV